MQKVTAISCSAAIDTNMLWDYIKIRPQVSCFITITGRLAKSKILRHGPLKLAYFPIKPYHRF
jgi:hypothetical protein